MNVEIVFIALFALATGVALVARRLEIPYTVALVAAGLALGFFHVLTPPHLTQELLYAFILPGLLFEAAYHLDAREFWRNRLSISLLAVPGVAAGLLLTAGILVGFRETIDILNGISVNEALVFGALMAATDPIAVVGLMKTLGAPRRLRVLLEGESLLNDGTALVVFTLILGVATGGSASAAGFALSFLKIVGAGVAAGVLVGLLMSKLTQAIDDPMIEITLTTIAAYGSFVLGETLHGSGVIATVAAGMICGNYGARTGMSPTTRIAAETFWEYVAFALNSIVFLLIGFEIRIGAVLAAWKPILAAFVAVLGGRALVVLAVTAVLRRTRERVPWPWSAVLTWSGLRGALSMVLVLGLPRELPNRDLLVTVTFGVVLLTLLLQGLSVGPLLRSLGLAESGHGRAAYEAQRGRLLAARNALDELDRMARQEGSHAPLLAEVRHDYEERAAAAEGALEELFGRRAEIRSAELRAVRRHLFQVEKEALIDGLQRGAVGRDAYEELLAEVDARLVRLEEGEDGEEGAQEVPSTPRG